MKKIFFMMGMMFLVAGTSYASEINDSETVESVGVFVRGLKMYHQEEWRNLTINLEYEVEEGSEINAQTVKNHIRMFLEKYSEPADFWEIMNIKLVGSLSETFSNIISMKSALSLAPDRTLRFPRESIVKWSRGTENLKESFNFTKMNYQICQKSFRMLNLHVAWDMKVNPTKWDYPDYQWIDQAMNEFFKENPISFTEWKAQKPELQTYLLERFPSLTSLDVEVTVAE